MKAHQETWEDRWQCNPSAGRSRWTWSVRAEMKTTEWKVRGTSSARLKARWAEKATDLPREVGDSPSVLLQEQS
jgi:hypothetical protein